MREVPKSRRVGSGAWLARRITLDAGHSSEKGKWAG